MTRDDCEAGVLLCDAIDEIAQFQQDLRRSKGTKDYPLRVFEMQSRNECSQGDGESIWWIKLDLETGRRIAAAAEQIILERIKELGITHPVNFTKGEE